MRCPFLTAINVRYLDIGSGIWFKGAGILTFWQSTNPLMPNDFYYGKCSRII